ncbi:ankyrin repeat domain-containing protein [Thermoflavimicrobium dichotomicum]|uniref:Ankyrin repeat n=1 Tax=Thermoflavimicrobium dichotomicum TaxID=46223 RepID=A0A1I3TXC0_9BACL|nr:ankyrin repeat domain-containing protein [Thermoflavimicrobium dichotomicum]SFJ75113.1 Ankyrin repeat [Thermoflavimicrobium dichotomicum]
MRYQDNDIFSVCTFGNEVALQRILKEHPDAVHWRDVKGNTPLHYAKNGTIVQILLQAGADPEAKNHIGSPPIDTACQKLRKSAIKVLLEKGVTLRKKYFDHPNAWMIRNLVNEHLKKMENRKLHEAQTLEEVKKHLADGEVIDGRADWGKTPLMVHTLHNRQEMIQYLIQQGADLNAQDEDGNTALHYAISKRAKQIAEILLKAGANPNIQNEKGETPLYIAVSANNKELVDLLLFYGADPKIRSKKGKLPMHAGKEHSPLFSELKEKLEQMPDPYPAVPNAKPYRFVIHPTKPLLISAMEGGGIVKWSYDPTHPQKEEFLWELQHELLAKVDFESFLKREKQIQTDQFDLKLHFSWDGNSILVQAPHLDCIERRSLETLEVIDQILGSYHCTITPNGRWMLDGNQIIDLKTNQIYPLTSTFGRTYVSPDGKYFFSTEYDQGGAEILITSAHSNKTDLVEYYLGHCPTHEFIDCTSRGAFSPDGKWVAVWGTALNYLEERPEGWLGDIIVLSTQKKRIKWRVPIAAEITEDPRSMFEQGYPGAVLCPVLFAGDEVVVYCPDGLLVFLDAETGELTRKIFFEENEIKRMLIDHTGKNLIVLTSIREYKIPL